MRETRFVRFPRQVGSGVANRQTIKSPGRGIHSLPISIRSSTGDHFHSARPFGATVRARFHRDVLPDRRWKRRSAFPLTARAALQRSSVHHRPGRCAGGGGCTRFSTTIFFRTFVRTCGRSSVYNRCTRLVFTCHPSRRSSMVRRRYPYRTCVEAIALSRAAGLPADLCRSTRKMGSVRPRSTSGRRSAWMICSSLLSLSWHSSPFVRSVLPAYSRFIWLSFRRFS